MLREKLERLGDGNEKQTGYPLIFRESGNKYEREDSHQLSCNGGRVPRFPLESEGKGMFPREGEIMKDFTHDYES